MLLSWRLVPGSKGTDDRVREIVILCTRPTLPIYCTYSLLRDNEKCEVRKNARINRFSLSFSLSFRFSYFLHIEKRIVVTKKSNVLLLFYTIKKVMPCVVVISVVNIKDNSNDKLQWILLMFRILKGLPISRFVLILT